MKRVLGAILFLAIIVGGYVAIEYDRKARASDAARSKVHALVSKAESYPSEQAAWRALVDAVHDEAFERNYLAFHLGMSGHLVKATSRRPPDKHTHVVIHFTQGGELRFFDANGATIRQVLGMRSGIPDLQEFTADGGFYPAERASSVVEVFRMLPEPKQEPPTPAGYASTNYVLLGAIIEAVRGQSWAAFLHERIFAPLGMTRTRVYSAQDIIADRASGYINFESLKNGLWFTPAYMESAAGGLVSTVQDMARWESALEAGTILKPSTLAQMEVPIKLNNGSIVQERNGTQYGLGWELQTYQGHRVVRHGRRRRHHRDAGRRCHLCGGRRRLHRRQGASAERRGLARSANGAHRRRPGLRRRRLRRNQGRG